MTRNTLLYAGKPNWHSSQASLPAENRSVRIAHPGGLEVPAHRGPRVEREGGEPTSRGDRDRQQAPEPSPPHRNRADAAQPRSGTHNPQCADPRAAPPAHLRMDNGPELVSMALRDWCRISGTETAYVEPGSP